MEKISAFELKSWQEIFTDLNNTRTHFVRGLMMHPDKEISEPAKFLADAIDQAMLLIGTHDWSEST